MSLLGSIPSAIVSCDTFANYFFKILDRGQGCLWKQFTNSSNYLVLHLLLIPLLRVVILL